MFIAVEGPALVGKTSLVNELTKRLGLERENEVHTNPVNRVDAIQRYVKCFSDYVPGESGHILLDGFYLKEATNIETSSRDGFGQLGVAGWRWTEMFFASRGGAVAMLTADNTTLSARADDAEREIDISAVLHASNRYEFARRESMNVVAIHETSLGETSADKYESFVTTLLDDARTREAEAAKIVTDIPHYIGALTPTTLLLDFDSDSADGVLPATPFEDSPSEFLLASLPDLFWRGVGIVDASVAGTDEIAILWQRLGMPNVVALGAEAYELTSGLDSSAYVTTVPHPDDVEGRDLTARREYGKLVRDAATRVAVEDDLQTTTESING